MRAVPTTILFMGFAYRCGLLSRRFGAPIQINSHRRICEETRCSLIGVTEGFSLPQISQFVRACISSSSGIYDLSIYRD